jgi:AcrR family transcriptional regulator
MVTQTRVRRSREEREQMVLDAAERLFYERGVHEVGMDELIRASGVGKASVYRLYPTKAELIGAYLDRLSATILALIDEESAGSDPATALHAVIDAIAQDVGRPGFRGCPFNNASIEFPEVGHPARRAAHDYRARLRERLGALAARCADGDEGRALGDELAVLIDGCYTSAAHLGPDGPAAAGLRLAHRLIDHHTNGSTAP